MRKTENIDNFVNWLSSRNGKPILKINPGFHNAAVVVDFGNPKVSVNMSSEMNTELCNRMKELAATLTGKKNFRVNYDHSHGVYWTSMQ